MSDVVVIGAGVMGASTAYHLAQRGASVTVLDKAPAPAEGVTGASFAWIGGCSGATTAEASAWPGGAADLCEYVIDDHRRLEGELPAWTVRWTGALTWARDTQLLAPGQHWVGQDEIASLEPYLREVPTRAAFAPTDGGVDPVHMTKAFLAAARTHGARVIFGSEVTSLEIEGGQVQEVVTSSGSYETSTVILAADTAVTTLCEPLGIRLPVTASPAVRLRVATRPGLINTIVVTPDFEAREVSDGQVLMTLPGTQTAGLSEKALIEPAEKAVETLQVAFRGADDARLLEHRVGWRPMPAPGPIVGPVSPESPLYIAVAHSAITLAPTIGRVVAQELDTGIAATQLSRCRPSGPTR